MPKRKGVFLGFLPLGNRSDVDVDPDLCFSGNTFFLKIQIRQFLADFQ